MDPVVAGFRGDFPAASLKRQSDDREYRSGRRFRGDFPAASLKLAVPCNAVLNRGGFRGDFPAASLKHLALV